ncbi:hypothetical protein GCM10009821_05650 [Aeromicrobium halocynthiae]|uniref:Uncharacterized protein n=1 Tax=Aeromicrobium halocynthiae TaxID=560557 RepID=A0ABN2VSU6_9ACTN
MCGPNQRIRAGVKVRLTATVTAIQIAIGGPVVAKMARSVKPRQMAPRMTVAAEASSAGPTRERACQVFCVSAGQRWGLIRSG